MAQPRTHVWAVLGHSRFQFPLCCGHCPTLVVGIVTALLAAGCVPVAWLGSVAAAAVDLGPLLWCGLIIAS